MNSYTDSLRKVKSLLIVTSLQKKTDIEIFEQLNQLQIDLRWQPLSNLMIDDEIWEYISDQKKYDPKLVFCHPDILKILPLSSLYYRGLSALSIKAAKDYFGAIEKIESGSPRVKISDDKALKMARVYNTFICSIIKGSTDWTLENGKRTIIATLGITLDGVMRNKIGAIAEERIRTLVVEWLMDKGLIINPISEINSGVSEIKKVYQLVNDMTMKFSSEPDISFIKNPDKGNELVAVVEIKGGIDPAGALERYGAATKSFQSALRENQKCRNFFLSAVYTTELENRIATDRLVEKYYDVIKILEEPDIREEFFNELFHYSLRII